MLHSGGGGDIMKKNKIIKCLKEPKLGTMPIINF